MANKPTLQEYLKQQEDFYENHIKFHPVNAFCGTAGEEEMKHIESLIDKLTDKELAELVTEAGIHFGTADIDRDEYERVVDEIDREDFYRLYAKVAKKK